MSTTPTAPLSGAELLARIKPVLREESTEVCLRPDLLNEWERLNGELATLQAELATAKESGTGRLTSAPSKKMRDLATEVQSIEDQIADASVTFRFRAMPKDEFRALCDDHPPRKDNQFDQYAGYDRDAVNDASVRKCLFDPVFDDESWPAFLAVCNPSEWRELLETAARANALSGGDNPKSLLASQILSKRGTTSQ